MSKEKTENSVKGQLITTKRKIFMAILPWAIIVVAGALFAGVVTGWTMRSSDYSRNSAEAQTIASQMLKAEK